MTDTRLSPGSAALVDEWRAEANRREAAAEAECAIGDEEWHLNQESARIYRKCADQLIAALSRGILDVAATPSGVHTEKDPQTAFNLGFRAAGGGCPLPPSAEALFQSGIRDGASHAVREREEGIPDTFNAAQPVAATPNRNKLLSRLANSLAEWRERPQYDIDTAAEIILGDLERAGCTQQGE